MTAWFGTLGRLQRIYSTPGMSVSGLPARTYETTLEGRVQVQVGMVGRREWELTATAAEPTDVGVLTGFALGEWGLGPFVWVSPTAPVTNLLTPDVSVCGGSAVTGATITQGGPLNLPDGSVVGRSLLNSNPAQNMYFGDAITPVIPGQPVTASAYVVGAGSRVGINFHDAAGVFISNAFSTATGTAGAATRLSVTVPAGSVPSNAASCSVFGATATQGARPAITWTDRMFAWQTGEGCPKAIVDTLSRTVGYASTDLGGRQDSDVSFVIKELG